MIRNKLNKKIPMLILFHRNRFKTNELVAKIDLDEELKFDYNSLISVSNSYHLDAEYKRKNDLNAFVSSSNLFNLKITDLSDGNNLLVVTRTIHQNINDIYCKFQIQNRIHNHKNLFNS